MAQVSETIGYQGQLLTTSGAPASGTHSLAFTLYADVSGTAVIWGPDSHSVDLSIDGFYSVDLDQDGSGSHFAQALITTPVYLGLAVDGAPLSPNQLIDAAPFSVVAAELRNPRADVLAGTVTLLVDGGLSRPFAAFAPLVVSSLSTSGGPQMFAILGDDAPITLGRYAEGSDVTSAIGFNEYLVSSGAASPGTAAIRTGDQPGLSMGARLELNQGTKTFDVRFDFVDGGNDSAAVATYSPITIDALGNVAFAGTFGDGGNLSVAGSYSLSRHGITTTTDGVYCGQTATSYSGKITDSLGNSGYRATKTICESVCSDPAAHMCSPAEGVRTGELGPFPGGTAGGWYATGVVAIYGSSWVDDCSGFTSNSSTEWGEIWTNLVTNGRPVLQTCSSTWKIACCN